MVDLDLNELDEVIRKGSTWVPPESELDAIIEMGRNATSRPSESTSAEGTSWIAAAPSIASARGNMAFSREVLPGVAERVQNNVADFVNSPRRSARNVAGIFGLSTDNPRMDILGMPADDIEELTRTKEYNIVPESNLPPSDEPGRKVGNIIGDLGTAVAEITVAKKLPGMARLGGLTREAVAWEAVTRAHSGQEGIGAAQGLLFGGIGSIQARDMAERVGKVLIEGGTIGAIEKIATGDDERATIMALVPVVMHARDLVGRNPEAARTFAEQPSRSNAEKAGIDPKEFPTLESRETLAEVVKGVSAAEEAAQKAEFDRASGKVEELPPSKPEDIAAFETVIDDRPTDLTKPNVTGERTAPDGARAKAEEITNEETQKGRQEEGVLNPPPESTSTPPVQETPVQGAVDPQQNVTGLDREWQDRIRKITGSTELPELDRRAWEDVLTKAKADRANESALDLATTIKEKPRTLTEEEHAGMVLKAAELMDQYKATIKKASDAIERGDETLAATERSSAESIVDQLDVLTEGARYAGREAGRALNIRKMLVKNETYELAELVQRARAAKGEKLTPEQQSSLEAHAKKIAELEASLKDADAKHEAYRVEQEKRMAELQAKKEADRVRKTFQRKATRESLLAERTDLKTKLAALGFRTNAIMGPEPESLFLLGKLATNYIREGALTLTDVYARMRQDIPDIELADVTRALAAKNPNAQKRARSEVTRRIMELRNQARLVETVKNAENGIFQQRKTPVRSEEIKALSRRLTELRKQAYKSGMEAKKLEKAIQKINELQDQLDKHYRRVRKQQPVPTEEMANLQQKMQDLRRAMAVEDELFSLNEQLRTGEFVIKERPAPKMLSPEVERKEIDLKRARKLVKEEIEALKPMTRKQKVIGKVSEVVNTARTLQTMGDFSTLLRQTLWTTVSHPIDSAKQIPRTIKATFSEFESDRVMNDIAKSKNNDLYQIHKLEILNPESHRPSQREELFRANFVERVPYLGSLVRASGRNMTTFGNLVRTTLFDRFIAENPNATRAELDGYADYLNAATGLGNLGAFRQAAKILSVTFFSPRFTVSRVQTPLKLYKYWDMPRVRKEIARDMTAVVATGMTTLGLAALAGADASLDPRDTDFGKIRIGDTRVDIWGGFLQPARLVARILTRATDRMQITGRGLTKEEKDIDPVEAMWRFFSFKLSPAVTIPQELLTGKTAVGEETTPTETILRRLYPLYIDDIREAAKEGNWGAAIASGAGAFVGLGVSTYDSSQDQVRNRIRKLLRNKQVGEAAKLKAEWNREHPQQRIVEVPLKDKPERRTR